jgi:hypothetical protein
VDTIAKEAVAKDVVANKTSECDESDGSYESDE